MQGPDDAVTSLFLYLAAFVLVYLLDPFQFAYIAAQDPGTTRRIGGRLRFFPALEPNKPPGMKVFMLLLGLFFCPAAAHSRLQTARLAPPCC